MRKIYKPLTEEQKAEGLIFTSTLSKYTTEQPDDLTHKIYRTDEDIDQHIERLKDDKFFNSSPWKYNIIRR